MCVCVIEICTRSNKIWNLIIHSYLIIELQKNVISFLYTRGFLYFKPRFLSVNQSLYSILSETTQAPHLLHFLYQKMLQEYDNRMVLDWGNTADVNCTMSAEWHEFFNKYKTLQYKPWWVLRCIRVENSHSCEFYTIPFLRLIIQK